MTGATAGERGEAAPVAGEAARRKAGGHRRQPRAGFLVLLSASVLVSLLSFGALTAMLLPPLQRAAAGEVAGQAGVDEDRAFSIGERTSVRLSPGWSVQSADEGGVLLRSPDRKLEVVMSEYEVAALASADDGAVLEETLENGARVRHLTDEGGFAAALALEGVEGEVLVRATAADGAVLADYRTALSELLLGVGPADRR